MPKQLLTPKQANIKKRIIALQEQLREIVVSLEGIVGDDKYIKNMFIRHLKVMVEDDNKSLDTSFNFDDLIEYLNL